ncbi:hypothetical protein ES708_13255 [subsurface metagenome]
MRRAQIKLEAIYSRFELLFQCFRTFFFKNIRRIAAPRQADHLRGQILLLAEDDRPFRRPSPSFVGVEQQRAPRGVSFEKSHLLRCYRCSQRGHTVFHPRLPEGQHIHISFDQDKRVFPADLLEHSRSPVQGFPLSENLRFRGVQVFRLDIRSQAAGPESGYLVSMIEDGEDDPASKKSDRFLTGEQPGACEELLGEFLFDKKFVQPEPVCRRVAQLKDLPGVLRHRPALQVRPRPGAFRMIQQEVMERPGDPPVQLQIGTFPLTVPFFEFDLHTGLLRQQAHRFHKRQFLHLHNEGEQTAPLVTAEAVEHRFIRGDGKGRCLLRMEWT